MHDSEHSFHKLVDTEEPLTVIARKDLEYMKNWDEHYPLLSKRPNDNRIDHFDIPYGSDPMQKLDIHYLRDLKNAPVVLYIHGGGWCGGDKSFSRFYAPILIEDGYVFVSINYRLAPAYKFPIQIEDCTSALKWVTDNISDYKGDPCKIGILGDSAGGHLTALLVAGSKWHTKFSIDADRIRCWVPISGVHDLRLKDNYNNPDYENLFNVFVNDDHLEAASPVSHITGNEPPSLIIHGSDDWIVPRTNSIALYDKLREKGADSTLQLIRGYWHINMTVKFGQSDHMATKYIRDFLKTHLHETKS
jgi:acetyl esterase/lipase